MIAITPFQEPTTIYIALTKKGGERLQMPISLYTLA